MLSTIKSRLIAICMLIVIAAIGVATLASYFSVSAHARRQVMSQLHDLGESHAGTMATWVKSQKNIVAALAPAAALEAPSPPWSRRSSPASWTWPIWAMPTSA